MPHNPAVHKAMVAFSNAFGGKDSRGREATGVAATTWRDVVNFSYHDGSLADEVVRNSFR